MRMLSDTMVRKTGGGNTEADRVLDGSDGAPERDALQHFFDVNDRGRRQFLSRPVSPVASSAPSRRKKTSSAAWPAREISRPAW